VAFYNQIEQYSDDYAEICSEESVIFVSNISDIFGNGYLKSDPIHPNEEGYGILAERVAQYLFDAGVIEYAVTCGETEELNEKMFDQVDGLIEEAVSAGIPERCMASINESYAMAEYLRENDYCYTAAWELEEKLVKPLVSMLEVEKLMGSAMEWINISVESGAPEGTIGMILDRYQNATKYSRACEFPMATVELEWILQTEIPQVCYPSVVIVSLFIFRLSITFSSALARTGLPSRSPRWSFPSRMSLQICMLSIS